MRRIGWLIFVVLAALGLSELIGIGPVFWFGQISIVPSIAGFILTLIVFLTFLLGGRARFSEILLKAPMKRVRREVLRSGGHGREPDILQKLLTEVAQASIDPRSLPGDVFADALSTAPANQAWPSDLPLVHSWLEASIQAIEDDLIIRVLIPERSRAAVSMLRALADSFREYIHQLPVRQEQLLSASDGGILFADFVSSLTGALVLADASQTRGGNANQARVWHANRYDPHPAGYASYASKHPLKTETVNGGDGSSCASATKLRDQSKTRAGDFDGRVLNVTGVALTQDERSGSINFLLTTTESCYAATEVSDVACKGDLGKALGNIGLDSRWSRHLVEMKVERNGAQKRLNMLTVVAALIMEATDGKDSSRSILLSRRASNIRNGNAVHSIVGGVMNLPVGGSSGDVDSLGFPDPSQAISRELKEELGLTIDPDLFTPVAVYTFNQRDPLRPGVEARGQFLTTISYVARLNMNLAQVKRERSIYSGATGRYELDELLEIAFPVVRKGKNGRKNAASLFAKRVRGLAHLLDQAAMIATIYAAVEEYSLTATAEAFAEAFPEPWQALNWDSDLEPVAFTGAHGRLARHPGSQIDPQWQKYVESAFVAETSDSATTGV